MILKHKVLIFASTVVGMGVGSLGVSMASAQTSAPPAAVTTTVGHASEISGLADGPGGHQDANGVDVQSGGGPQDASGADATAGGGA